MGCYNSKVKSAFCIICGLEAEKVLFPCGHFCLCNACNVEMAKARQGGSNLKININLEERHGVNCPVCRTIAFPMNVYYPI